MLIDSRPRVIVVDEEDEDEIVVDEDEELLERGLPTFISLQEIGFTERLEQLPAFGDDYLSALQPPGETIQRVLQSFCVVQYSDAGGINFRLIDLFRATCHVVASGTRGVQPVDLQECDVFLLGAGSGIGDLASDGSWILKGAARLAGSRRLVCSRCGKQHEMVLNRVFARLPEFLLLDFSNEPFKRAGGLARVPVAFPLREFSAAGALSREVAYALFAFVEVADNHARAFVRIGPAHFKVCNDHNLQWARIPAESILLKGRVTLGMFRAVAAGP
jgi:hypothetical protein